MGTSSLKPYDSQDESVRSCCAILGGNVSLARCCLPLLPRRQRMPYLATATKSRRFSFRRANIDVDDGRRGGDSRHSKPKTTTATETTSSSCETAQNRIKKAGASSNGVNSFNGQVHLGQKHGWKILPFFAECTLIFLSRSSRHYTEGPAAKRTTTLKTQRRPTPLARSLAD